MLEYEPDKRIDTKRSLRHEFLNQYYATSRNRSHLYQDRGDCSRSSDPRYGDRQNYYDENGNSWW